jgi:hypothetical protein
MLCSRALLPCQGSVEDEGSADEDIDVEAIDKVKSQCVIEI